MGYPQITQIRTDCSEQNTGFRLFQIPEPPLSHLWKSVKSVDKNPLPPGAPTNRGKGGMGYPQITQIRTDCSEQNNGSRLFQITKDTPFPICGNL